MAIAYLSDFLLLSLVRIVTRMPRVGISKDVFGAETLMRMEPLPDVCRSRDLI